MNMKTKTKTSITMIEADTADLLQKIKLHEHVVDELTSEIKLHIARVRASAAAEQRAGIEGAADSLKGMDLAEPERWAALGRTSIQQGFMSFTRAVAQLGQ
jgi:hypothetical protein